MNENTRKLNEIFNYCKSHRGCVCNCVIERNCIFSKKKSRYNDSRFVNEMYNKVERALKKEEEDDPFKQFKTSI